MMETKYTEEQQRELVKQRQKVMSQRDKLFRALKAVQKNDADGFLYNGNGDSPIDRLVDSTVSEIEADCPSIAYQDELEREIMRLAACGVVAMADTLESSAKVRDMHPSYRSASCDDVARRVDECIELRAQRDKLIYLLKQASAALDSGVQYAQDHHDEPPYPASQWDYEAYRLSHEIDAAITSLTD